MTKKTSPRKKPDTLRPEYDLTQLGAGVRGKYYKQATEPLANRSRTSNSSTTKRRRTAK